MEVRQRRYLGTDLAEVDKRTAATRLLDRQQSPHVQGKSVRADRAREAVDHGLSSRGTRKLSEDLAADAQVILFSHDGQGIVQDVRRHCKTLPTVSGRQEEDEHQNWYLGLRADTGRYL